MRKRIGRLIFVFCLLLDLARVAAAEAPVRVVVLPLRPDEPRLAMKEDGEAIADHIFAKSHDLPGVEWVERSALDKLLAEAEFRPASGGGSSGITLGRLLKADILIQGRVTSGKWEEVKDGKRPFRVPLSVEIIAI